MSDMDERISAQAEKDLDEAKTFRAQMDVGMHIGTMKNNSDGEPSPLQHLTTGLSMYLAAGWGIGKQLMPDVEARKCLDEAHGNVQNWLLSWRAGYEVPEMDWLFAACMPKEEFDDEAFRSVLTDPDSSTAITAYVSSVFQTMMAGELVKDSNGAELIKKRIEELGIDMEDEEEDTEGEEWKEA